MPWPRLARNCSGSLLLHWIRTISAAHPLGIRVDWLMHLFLAYHLARTQKILLFFLLLTTKQKPRIRYIFQLRMRMNVHMLKFQNIFKHICFILDRLQILPIQTYFWTGEKSIWEVLQRETFERGALKTTLSINLEEPEAWMNSLWCQHACDCNTPDNILTTYTPGKKLSLSSSCIRRPCTVLEAACGLCPTDELLLKPKQHAAGSDSDMLHACAKTTHRCLARLRKENIVGGQPEMNLARKDVKGISKATIWRMVVLITNNSAVG